MVPGDIAISISRVYHFWRVVSIASAIVYRWERPCNAFVESDWLSCIDVSDDPSPSLSVRMYSAEAVECCVVLVHWFRGLWVNRWRDGSVSLLHVW